MLDHTEPSFAMIRARAAIARGLNHIEEQVIAIERAIEENSGLVFDLSKAIVESVCRTILRERGVSYRERDDLPRLFQMVRDNLSVLPEQESQEAAVRDSVVRTLGGLSGTIQGIAELRNQLSFAAHGGDSARPSMEQSHGILAAQSADTIVGFLYHIHAPNQDSTSEAEFSTDRDSDFDSYVDDQYEIVDILGSQFLPSEILFQMEPNSYRIFLADFQDDDPDSKESE